MIEELNQAIALPARSGSKCKALLHMIPYDHERRRTAQSVQQRIMRLSFQRCNLFVFHDSDLYRERSSSPKPSTKLPQIYDFCSFFLSTLLSFFFNHLLA